MRRLWLLFVLFTFLDLHGQIKVGVTNHISIGHNLEPQSLVDMRSTSSQNIMLRLWNQGSGGSTMRYVSSNNATAQIQLTTTNEWLAAITGNSASGLEFKVRIPNTPNTETSLNNSSHLVIDRDGEIGIGTTNPTYKLEVQGQIFTSECIISPSTSCTSDLRTKSNIRNYESGLDEVLRMAPKTFCYNGQGGTKTGSQHIGLIAQEVLKVAPELVQKGNAIDEHDDPYLQIRESEIKYLIINAVKEQQVIIEQLKKRIEKLESAENE